MVMIVILLLQIAFFANLLLLPFAIYDLGFLMGLLWTLLVGLGLAFVIFLIKITCGLWLMETDSEDF